MSFATARNVGFADPVEHGWRKSRTVVVHRHGDSFATPADANGHAPARKLHRVLDNIAQPVIEFWAIGDHGLGTIVIARGLDVQDNAGFTVTIGGRMNQRRQQRSRKRIAAVAALGGTGDAAERDAQGQ